MVFSEYVPTSIHVTIHVNKTLELKCFPLHLLVLTYTTSQNEMVRVIPGDFKKRSCLNRIENCLFEI